MVRWALALVLLLSVRSVAAAPSSLPVTVKGFVISRSAGALAIRHVDGSTVTVRLLSATVISGVRTSGGEIAVGDLVRADGMREVHAGGDDVVLAAHVEVVLGVGALERSTRPAATNSVFWNWVLNGSFSLPVR